MRYNTIRAELALRVSPQNNYDNNWRPAAVAAGIRSGSRRSACSRGGAGNRGRNGGALQIWFVRHAESEINVPGNPRPVPDGGVTYPLTRKGVEQAKALAEATASAPIVALYTSTTCGPSRPPTPSPSVTT